MEESRLPKGWLGHEGILYRKYKDPKPSEMMAIFDMDATLMLTPSTIVPELVKGMDIPIQKPAFPSDYVLYASNWILTFTLSLRKFWVFASVTQH
ncbi:hypothetical protein BdWA1_000074 [Babesia duncani]|uniref:Uncharacterized protein n=1 Tax=Babesia duncani TaxID=323732 RepID=A0AAD9PLM4_9APIC|nr:hypothetical protein BdWA1_000074 [Babesia duncani]